MHGTAAYVTLASNDDAVDFILQADRCLVGDPPCELVVKTARPRDFPRANYPTDEVLSLVDQQDARDKGIAHGMTDSQVAAVTTALGQMQESTLKLTVERLTGAVTGLPIEFQAAVNNRLMAIESAINANSQAMQRNTTALNTFKIELQSATLGNSDRIDSMEKAMVGLTEQMARMAAAQKAANSYNEWTPDEEYAQGEGEPDISYFKPAAQRPADVSLEPEVSPQSARLGPADPAPSPTREPRAIGGVNMSQVLGGEAPQQLTPLVDASPTGVGQVPVGIDAESSESKERMETDGCDTKRLRDSDTEDAATVSKRAAPVEVDDLDLWDCTPQLSQEESDSSSALSQLTSASALSTPHVQLRPGYTAFVCAQYITAWNNMAGQPHASIGNGCSAAELLLNGLAAEKRLAVISRAINEEETKGYRRSDALKALTQVHSIICTERARINDLCKTAGNPSPMSKLTTSEEPTGRCASARLI